MRAVSGAELGVDALWHPKAAIASRMSVKTWAKLILRLILAFVGAQSFWV
jgi:hypothetical protein